MSNMSYCRFENTSSDLRDCVEALEELADETAFGDGRPLSSSERVAADWMVKLCRRYLEAHSRLLAAEGEGEG